MKRRKNSGKRKRTKSDQFQIIVNAQNLAGAPGFEPGNGGIKILRFSFRLVSTPFRCLQSRILPDLPCVIILRCVSFVCLPAAYPVLTQAKTVIRARGHYAKAYEARH